MRQLNQISHYFYFAVLIVFTVMVTVSFANEGGADTTNSWSAPASAKNIKNPIKVTQDNIEKGKTIFAQQCAVCHGKSGKGDGPSAQYLGKPLPDFTSANFSQQSDGEIFWKLTNGNAPMPTFEKIISEEQRWQLINFIRTFNGNK